MLPVIMSFQLCLNWEEVLLLKWLQCFIFFSLQIIVLSCYYNYNLHLIFFRPVCCRWKVGNEKSSLSKPETTLNSYTDKKVGVSESYQNSENDIFAENSIVEVMQETVRDNVDFLLKKLEESHKKDNLPAAEDVQSPSHYISSLTTLTSSLAIHDDPLPQFVPQTSHTLSCPSDGCAFEASTEENQKESLFMDIQEGENTIEDNAEKEDHNKYVPVTYKSSANETLGG
jgi:hypothetical protein